MILESIYHFISMAMLIGICITFYTSFYWNIRYIRETKRTLHKTRTYYALACLLVGMSYTYVLISSLTPSPMEYSLVAGLILRPVLFLLGCSLVAVAKQRYFAEIHQSKKISNLQETIDKLR